jgi:biotin carboxylase
MGSGKNALIIGYRDHRVAQHARSLSKLKESGLIKEVHILASRSSPETPVDSRGYPFSVEYDSERKREYAESGSETPEEFLRYCADIREAALQTASDLVFPTTDRAVIATASAHSKGNMNTLNSNPDLPIIETFQDKARTYDFLRAEQVFKTPSFRTVKYSDLEKLGSSILLRGISGPYFAKPACPQSGGSIGTGQISNTAELAELMRRNQQYKTYLVSQFLEGPEINHTIIVNPDGSVATQCTYEEVPKNDDKNHRISISNEELNAFGHRFGKAIKKSFRYLDFRGVYNVDFLRNESGDLFVSEINPGRFPACMSVFNGGAYDPMKPLIKAISGKSEKYPETHKIGTRFDG